MDLASTLMGLGLLLVFVAPVGFLVFNQSNKVKKRAKKMAFLAGQQGLNLDETENIHGLSLALDRTAKKFLLLKGGKEAKLQIVDLNSISKAEVIKLDEDEKSTSTLDDIREIALLVATKDTSSQKLLFYAEEEDPVTEKAERLDKALQWQKILQKYSHS